MLHLIAVGISLLLLTGIAAAQIGGVLVYGGSVTGTISATSPLMIYNFAGNAGDTITLRAIPLNPGTELAITLLSPSQQLVATGDRDPFLPTSTDARVDARLAETGQYSVLIGGVNGSAGDFLLRLDARFAVAAQQLIAGTPSVADFSIIPTAQIFNLLTADITQLNVRALTAGFGFNLQLRNTNGALIAVIDGLPQASLTIPGAGMYEISVVPTNPDLTGSVELVVGTGIAQAAPTTAPQVVAPAPTDRCTVSSSGSVNIRSGAGTNFTVIGSLNAGQYLDVTGVVADRTWYAVNTGSGQGWVAASVVSLNGPCNNLSVVQSPTAVPVAATATQANNAAPTATEQTNNVAPTATQPAPTATTAAPAAPIDNDYSVALDRNSGGQFSDVISYPDGDRSDRVSARVENFDSVNTFAQFNVTVVCNGTGAEFVRWGTTPNSQNLSCNSSVNMIFTTDSNNNSVFISLPDGSGQAYVNYTIIYVRTN